MPPWPEETDTDGNKSRVIQYNLTVTFSLGTKVSTATEKQVHSSREHEGLQTSNCALLVRSPVHNVFCYLLFLQTVYGESKPGCIYVVDTEVSNANIPYADSFYVTNRYCITKVSAHKSRLRVSSEIHYKKHVWGLVKSKTSALFLIYLV